MVEISGHISLIGLLLFLIAVRFYRLKVFIEFQDLAASIDNEDVANFTRVVKEFESITRLVYHYVSRPE